jgi:hypothetical protein
MADAEYNKSLKAQPTPHTQPTASPASRPEAD